MPEQLEIDFPESGREKLLKRYPEIATPEAYRAYLEREDLVEWIREADRETCTGCDHFREGDLWCSLQDLPASFNPVFTPKTGMLGMACMGVGHTNPDSDENNPF